MSGGVRLTEEFLVRVTGAYDLELVQRLDISGKSVASLNGIELCTNLVELVAADNIIDNQQQHGSNISAEPKTTTSRDLGEIVKQDMWNMWKAQTCSL